MSHIHLILSSRKPWDAVYRTQEGQAIYKVEAAKPTLGTREIKISRVIPSILENQVATKDVQEEHLKDSFGHLATIEYNTIGSSRIRMGSLDVATNEYFKEGGWRFFGRNRVFTGPDGIEYSWSLGSRRCKLFMNDSSKTLVAKFRRRRLGIIGKARPASLEIFTAGKDMVDFIVVTGVYVEKLRKGRERAARNY